MLMKLFLFFLGAWLLLGVLSGLARFWLKRKLIAWQQRLRPSTDSPHPQAAPEEKSPIADDMVACAHCGVFVVSSLAFWRQGRYFCSEPHAQL